MDDVLTDSEIEDAIKIYEQYSGKYFIPTRVPEQDAFLVGFKSAKIYFQQKNSNGDNDD